MRTALTPEQHAKMDALAAHIIALDDESIDARWERNARALSALAANIEQLNSQMEHLAEKVADLLRRMSDTASPFLDVIVAGDSIRGTKPTLEELPFGS